MFGEFCENKERCKQRKEFAFDKLSVWIDKLFDDDIQLTSDKTQGFYDTKLIHDKERYKLEAFKPFNGYYPSLYLQYTYENEKRGVLRFSVIS